MASSRSENRRTGEVPQTQFIVRLVVILVVIQRQVPKCRLAMALTATQISGRRSTRGSDME